VDCLGVTVKEDIGIEIEEYRATDDCPLFSPALENHLVGVLNGSHPNQGNFCSYCFTPMGMDEEICPECDLGSSQVSRVRTVPPEIVEAMRQQRSIESRWVNGFAYLGVLIAVIGGIIFVLATPIFDENLILATIAYGLILLIGSRVLAGLLGGIYGDRIGYERGRRSTREHWESYISENPPSHSIDS
tara:strand:+ start:337 stop:900 length:564 start_codon:yes stop_codon:yes gene_type:complete